MRPRPDGRGDSDVHSERGKLYPASMRPRTRESRISKASRTFAFGNHRFNGAATRWSLEITVSPTSPLDRRTASNEAASRWTRKSGISRSDITTRSRFNGAATDRRRYHVHCIRLVGDAVASMRPRPWVAEILERTRTTRVNTGASMTPRPWGRGGRQPRPVEPDGRLHASMRPRPWGRGEPPPPQRTCPLQATASMRARPGGRGDLSYCNSGLGRNTSFNEAVTLGSQRLLKGTT